MSNYEVSVRLTADGRGLVGETRAAKEAIGGLGDASRKTSAESASFTSQIDRQNSSISSLKAGMIAAAGAYVSFNAAINGGKAVIDAALAQERLNNSLKVGLGSQQAATQEIKYLREEADKLGLQFTSTAEQYAKLTAASKGTALQGQATRDIFLSIAKASTVLGLSADQTGGALTAIEQIISKGKVSAEELRGQLGERLPGAFQIAARAINVTTAELDEMLSRGQLTAEQLLPALARELENTYGAQAQEAAQGLNAQINRLDNAFTDLKLAVGEAGIIDMFSDAVIGATQFIGITAQVIQQLRGIAAEVNKIPGLGAAASSVTPGNVIKAVTGNNILGNIASSGILGQIFGKEERAEVTATTQELEKAEEVINRIIRPGAKPEPPNEFMAALKKEAAEREKLAKAAQRETEKAIKAADREAKQRVDSAQRVINSLIRETEEIGKNTVQKRLMAAAAEAAAAPTKELAAEIMATAQAWAQATDAQNRALASQREQEEAATARARAETEAARQVQQEWDRMWSTVENTARTSFIQFAAHGTDAMESIGRSIQNSIIDLLYQLTVRKWIISVGASFSGAGDGGSGSNLLDMASNGFGITNLFSKAGSFLSGSAASGASFLGNATGIGALSSFGAGASGAASSGVFGAGGSAFLAGEGTALGAVGAAGEFGAAASMGATFAAAAGPAIALLAVDQIGKLLANGRTTGTFVDKIPVINGLAGALFGRKPFKPDRQELVGDITAGGFSGVFNDSHKAKGSLARGSRRDNIIVDTDSGELLNQFGRLSESGISKQLSNYIDPAIERALELGEILDESIASTANSLTGVADKLGISKAALDEFSLSVDLVSEKGEALSDAQIAQVIANAAEQMATALIPEISNLANRGETALQAVVRLSAEFTSLEGALRLTGNASAEAQALLRSFSAEQRSAAVVMAGGVDALGAKSQYFFDNVLTDTQKFEIVSADLRKELEKYAVSTIPTIEQLNAAVTGGKLEWEQLVAALTLAPQIVQANRLRDSINAALSSAPDAIGNVENAFSILQRSVAAERESLTNAYNDSIAAVNDEIGKVTDSIGKLKTLSAALNQTVVALRPIGRDQAKQQIQEAINAARSGGNLPDADSLREALTSIARVDTKGFSSGFEVERERRLSANLVAELGGLTDSQLSAAEDRLSILKDQRKLLDENFDQQIGRLNLMLDQGQEQIDTLKGIDTSIKSLADALAAFSRAAAAAGGGDGGINSGASRSRISGGVATALPTGQGRGSSSKPTLEAIQSFVSAPGRTPEQVYAAALKTGVSGSELSTATGIPISSINKWVDSKGLPRFATGGFHTGGLRIVGERGPELEATGPARIASNNDLQKMLSNDDLVISIQELIKLMKTDAKYSKRVSRKLDRFTATDASGQPVMKVLNAS
ncbi:tape measure domain-containing protein [Nitrosomonas aestuarii]|uniref:Tape measure domain-containing protein n=1 Tax=Nitrosomonas aestuarii TaxID=52441 RepID=A0A1I4DFI1_9PROT|nr:tape measure protein [Nitrosomonas aestuarii]SFK91965.1 tape measure domain-containing protein [Nitrosomonas aestuarii]